MILGGCGGICTGARRTGGTGIMAGSGGICMGGGGRTGERGWMTVGRSPLSPNQLFPFTAFLFFQIMLKLLFSPLLIPPTITHLLYLLSPSLIKLLNCIPCRLWLLQRRLYRCLLYRQLMEWQRKRSRSKWCR